MSEAIRLLLVEDNQDDANLTVMQLESEGFTLDWQLASTPGALTAALAQPQDVVIADYNIPGMDVRDTITAVLGANPDIPVIVVSGSMSAETGVELMHLGAQDYVGKSALTRLGAALQKGLERTRERARLRNAESEYTQLFERLPVGVARSLPTGETEQINAALLRILRYPDRATYLANTSPLSIEFLAPEDRALLAARLTAESIVNGVETSVRRYDGTRVWLSLDLRANRGPEGEIQSVDTVVTDIDDRRRAHSALERANRDLGETTERLRESDSMRQRLLERLITAQEEERHRIALDIHDDAVQVMAASSIRLVLLAKKVNDEGLSAEIKLLVETVTQSTARLRNLMFELEPPGLERHGLVVSVRRALENMTADTGIPHTLSDALEDEPPHDVSIMIYRITQEALANVRKHSQATTVTVDVRTRGSAVAVSIADDGVGFDSVTNREVKGHIGLASMRERTLLAGGTWNLVSSPGSGTHIEFQIPPGGSAGASTRLKSATAA